MARRKEAPKKTHTASLAGLFCVAKIVTLLQRVCESLPMKIVAIVSALVTIGTLTHRLVHHQQSANAPERSMTFVSARGPKESPVTGPVVQQPLAARFTVQNSYGAQSPNVSDVNRDVHIKYRTQLGEASQKSRANTSVVPWSPPHEGSVIQTSQDAQSPNITGVGGSVDIQYGLPVRHDGKSSESTK